MARAARLAFAAVFTAILFTPSSADACSCVEGVPMCEIYWKTPVVFAGEVVDISTDEPKPPENRPGLWHRRRVRFRVENAYRGTTGAETVVYTGMGGGDCGYHFTRGQKYLVFAHSYEGRLTTGICSRTKPLSAAAADIAYIMRPDSEASRIYGRAVFRNQADQKFAADTEVQLRGAGGTRTTRTDRSGQFEIKDVPAGKYQIQLMAPRGWWGSQARDVDLADSRGCAVVDFHLVPDGRVHLKVTNTVVEATKPVGLELIDADALLKPNQRHYGTSGLAVTTGDVTWSQVPPGRYVIGLNITREPNGSQPYAPTFYPGVTDPAAAKVIEVGLGAQVELPPFAIPERRPMLQVRGTIVRKDSRVVPSAAVALVSDEPFSRGRVAGTSESDRDGRFTLAGVTGIRYRVRTFVNGVRTESEPFELTAATAPLLVVLR